MSNNFFLNLIATLQKARSRKQLQTDAKSIGDIYVDLIGRFSMSNVIKTAKNQFKNLTFTITPTVNAKGIQKATKQAINSAQKVSNNNKIHINFDVDKQQLINQLKIFGRDNNKLFNNRDMAAKYNQLLNSANAAKSTGEIKTLRGELSAFKTELVATNNAGMTWGSKFKESIKNYAQFFGGASFIYALANQLREAWTEAVELDKSYTDLIKVQSELTRGDYPAYLEQCNKKAQELATTQKSLIEGATEFSKSGYTKTQSDQLAEKSIILSNVGDMSASDSAKAIISGVQAYDVIDGYDNVIDKAGALIDKYNEIGNTASITTAEIAQGVQTVGSVFSDANTSVDQFIALLSAGNRQFQNADTLALGLRTAALRIRGCKAELEKLGETTEDVYTSSSKLAAKIEGLTNVDGKGGIQILEADGKTFRSIYDIFVDISKVYQKMSDTDQSALLDLIAGKNRASAISATLNNMSEAQEIYERSLHSAGSAQKEYDTYLESSEASLNRFKSNLTETYQSIINGNTVRDLANLGSAVLSFANSFGIIEGTLKGIVAIGLGKFITTGTMAFVSATKQVEQYGRALQMANNIPNGNLAARYQALKSIAQATSNLTTTQLKNVLASKTLTQQDRIRILQMQGMTKEMALQKLAEMNLTQATNAQTAANAASTASTFSLKAAMMGLGATIKSVFLSNRVGIALMAISLGVSAITSAVSNHNQKMDEMRQKTKEAADEASTLTSEISELANKYISLSEAVKTDSSSKEDLLTVQDELIKKLGIEGESIDSLIAKYGSLDAAIKTITLEELGDKENDLIAGVKAAEDELKNIGKGYANWYSLTDRNILSSAGDEAVKAYDVLNKAGIISDGSYGIGGGALVLTGDDSTVEGILENYQKLQDALDALRKSGEFTEEELTKNPVFSQIYNRAQEMKEFVDGYNDSIANLNQNIAQQMIIKTLQGNELPKTEEEFEGFKQSLIDSAQASDNFIGSQEDIKKSINSVLSKMPQFKQYFEELTDVQKEASKVTPAFSRTDMITAINSMSEGFEELDKIYSSISDKDPFDFKLLDDKIFKENFSGLDSYADFVEQVTDNADDINACQEAFNTLVTEWIDKSGILDKVTAENENLTAAYLKQMGVVNADELAHYGLEKAKAREYIQSKDNIDVTSDNIGSLIEEANAAGVSTNAYLELLAKEILFNDNGLDTSSKCNQILEIARAAGIAAVSMSTLNDEIANVAGKKLGSGARTEYARSKGVEVIFEQDRKDGKKNGNLYVVGGKEIDDFEEAMQYAEAYNTMQNISAAFGQYKVSNYTGGSKSKSAKDGSSSEKDSKKTFDWIEKALTRIKEAYDRLNKVVSATYKSWSTRNNALAQEIGNIRDQIALNQKAYEGYMAQANSVGLSDYYKTLVQNGAISIEDITDKDLQEQIENYQTWFEKAISCSDAIAELENNLADLAKTQFDNTAKQFDERISLIEHETDMLNGTLTIIENRGYLASAKLYDSLIQNESKKLSELQSKYASLSNEIKGIEEGTEMWYDMYEQILSVEKEIQDSTNSIVEFNNKIRELQWDVFDKLQERMSAVTDEAEFFIDLMSNNKLFTDEGITDFGRATFGLHAVNLNTYMAQADEYAKELKQINEDLADDPNNLTLLERRNELIDAQREMIKNAEQEKQSIKDLVSDGYDVMLDALQKLVDKQKDLLDSQKDLYDYQKNIEQQTKNIASLEKQLGAYSGDTSEETQAKIQQIKVDLESARQDLQETEYEKFISDTEQVLDGLYD